MCQMDYKFSSSGPKSVSFHPNGTWASETRGTAYTFQQERARFQQKQLQEKEEKLLKLYEEQQERALRRVGSHSGGSSVSSTSSVGVGKVRHLFQSRRENSEVKSVVAIAGRDKSHPLKPLQKHSSAKGLERNRETGHWGISNQERSFSINRRSTHFSHGSAHYTTTDINQNIEEKPFHQNSIYRKSQKHSQHYNEFDYEPSFRIVDDRSKNKELRKVKNAKYHFEIDTTEIGSNVLSANNQFGKKENKKNLQTKVWIKERDLDNNKMNNKYKSYVSENTFSKKAHLGTENTETRSGLNGTGSNGMRKTRKPTPVPQAVSPSQKLLRNSSKEIYEMSNRSGSNATSPTSQGLGSGKRMSSKCSPDTPRSNSVNTRIASAKSDAGTTLVDCKICSRNFTADRIAKHEEVCKKTKKNRKPFDAVKQRAVPGNLSKPLIEPSKKLAPTQNWRQKHEELIKNIRAAREITLHLKKGGKLSDLPPPVPSSNPDYTQCPHCLRRFNESAASRHIPKCANITSNKSKSVLSTNSKKAQLTSKETVVPKSVSTVKSTSDNKDSAMLRTISKTIVSKAKTTSKHV